MFEQTFATLAVGSKPPRLAQSTPFAPSHAPPTVVQDEVVTDPASDPDLVASLETSTRLLVRTVDAMTDDQWAAPSLLPGWSRAHVVAHLTLTPESQISALRGLQEGRAVPMYTSDAVRDQHIADLAGCSPSYLRDRLLASSTGMGDWITKLSSPGADWTGATFERTPGGRIFRAADIPFIRLREIEIHHADLGLDYTSADWTTDFVERVLDWRTEAHTGNPCLARATDLDREWRFGTGGPTVSGPANALAWWATGRGTGADLTSDSGELPTMGAI